MKTLKAIQALSKIGKVLSKILFIFCIIGFCGCIVGILSMALSAPTLKIGGATLESVLATPGQNAISVGCCTGKNQAGGISINEEELRKIIHEVAKNMR